MEDLIEDTAAMIAALPPHLRPVERLDEAGRLSAAGTCRQLGVDGAGLADLVAAGHLPGTRKDDGTWWFIPDDVEAARAFVRRGRGRPPIGDAVEVRFPPALLARVDQLACDSGVPRAEMVRRLVASALDVGQATKE